MSRSNSLPYCTRTSLSWSVPPHVRITSHEAQRVSPLFLAPTPACFTGTDPGPGSSPEPTPALPGTDTGSSRNRHLLRRTPVYGNDPQQNNNLPDIHRATPDAS
eukprot:jgi/Psemu1/47982/gm1.47982_g